MKKLISALSLALVSCWTAAAIDFSVNRTELQDSVALGQPSSALPQAAPEALASGPEASASAPEKLRAHIGGRFLLEGGFYAGRHPETLLPRANVTDVRLTGQLFYDDWYLRIDVGFDGNKVGLKDSFLQFARKGNCFRIGHMLGPFGIDPAVSTYDYMFNAPANIHNLVYFGRHIGMTYTRTGKHYYASAGAFMGDLLTVDPKVRQGFNSALRAVWRPINEDGRVLQFGASGIFRIPDTDKTGVQRGITLGATGVTCLQSPMFQQVTIADARNENIVGGEFYLSWKKWLVQAEYMGMFINRKAAPFYTAHGGYIQAGYLITGSSFGYDSGEALPTAPAQPKSLQLVARYNFSTLNDPRTSIKGGRQHDISAGLNYQFNKYISSRLNYNFILTDSCSPLGKAALHQLQARIAFWF